MITNEAQYELATATGRAQDRSPELQAEVAEYEDLRDRGVSMFDASSAEELGVLLIRARIARGWSQAQLADALGLPVSQVEQDELDGNRSLSLARVQAVADALGLAIATWGGWQEDGPL